MLSVTIASLKASMALRTISSDDLMVLVNVELSGTSKAVSCCLISSLIFDRPPALFLSKGVTL